MQVQCIEVCEVKGRDQCSWVQQAPKLGESLELPLGPPVSLEVPLFHPVLCSVGWCRLLWTGVQDLLKQALSLVQGASVPKGSSHLGYTPTSHLLPFLTYKGDYIAGGCSSTYFFGMMKKVQAI